MSETSIPLRPDELTDLTADDIETIDDGRRAIDELDAQVIALLQARREVSQRIQSLRLDSGGPRTDCSREMRVVDRYRGGLPKHGARLAIVVLELCRGSS